MTSLLLGTATLRFGWVEKTVYILLAFFDLGLTLVAFRLGLTELNPLMSKMLLNPGYLLLFKVFSPVLIAWLVPGRLLVPAILLLAAVTGWNLKELVTFLM